METHSWRVLFAWLSVPKIYPYHELFWGGIAFFPTGFWRLTECLPLRMLNHFVIMNLKSLLVFQLLDLLAKVIPPAWSGCSISNS